MTSVVLLQVILALLFLILTLPANYLRSEERRSSRNQTQVSSCVTEVEEPCLHNIWVSTRRWRSELTGRLFMCMNHGNRSELTQTHSGFRPQVRFSLHWISVCVFFLLTGKMKDLAFIQDPDGYWIEILSPSKMFSIMSPLGGDSVSDTWYPQYPASVLCCSVTHQGSQTEDLCTGCFCSIKN